MTSAVFVGFVHTLAPGHWLPVVLMAKVRKWPLRTAMIGATVTALGHILLSIGLGGVSLYIGSHFLAQYENQIERYAGLVLAVFGLVYAGISYFRHSQCHGHTHHGPDPRGQKTPFLFLFSLGFSPCIAVLPVFLTAATEGAWIILMTLISFAVGVLVSLWSATALVSQGIVKLDHPWFEHYGDVITGLGVTLMGGVLFSIS